MPTTRRSLVIAVAPRLLGDALSVSLERDDRDISVLCSRNPVNPAAAQDGPPRFDIAVVSDHTPELMARVVIRLPDGPFAGYARVGDEPVAVANLDGLIALVDRCAATMDGPARATLSRPGGGLGELSG